MKIEREIKIKHYKCFGENEQGFQQILPINLIIGKNNSGKSSLIDLIEYVANPLSDLIQSTSTSARCLITSKITDKVIDEVATLHSKNKSQSRESWLTILKNYASQKIKSDTETCVLASNGNLSNTLSENDYGQYASAFLEVFRPFRQKKNFRRINAERNIIPEAFYPKNQLTPNGANATILIWKYLSLKDYDQNLIRKELLQALNEITNPDIKFTDILIKENDELNRAAAIGEIYFEYPNGTWVALSKMGSGIKTILLVLLNLIVIPASSATKANNYIYGFEELENNLHPSIQRRLFSYIADFAINNSCHFFITTHSNVPIDLYSNNPNAQILHVLVEDSQSYVKTIETHFERKNILTDLDYKASDILLSNGVIWVEGPSDAIYLELFIDLYWGSIQQAKNSLSYTIQVLSTSLWKYAGFQELNWSKVDTNIENRIISLARLNHKHLIVLDSDNNYEPLSPSSYKDFKSKIGQYKAKLISETMTFHSQSELNLETYDGNSNDSKLLFWITPGTIETYLEEFVSGAGRDFEKYFDLKKLRGYFEKIREGKFSSITKTKLAMDILSFAEENNLNINHFAPSGSKLIDKLSRLFNTIKSWN